MYTILKIFYLNPFLIFIPSVVRLSHGILLSLSMCTGISLPLGAWVSLRTSVLCWWVALVRIRMSMRLRSRVALLRGSVASRQWAVAWSVPWWMVANGNWLYVNGLMLMLLVIVSRTI